MQRDFYEMIQRKGAFRMQNKRRFFLQALLMTGVTLLLRSVGVSAQVIIAAKIGEEAVGVSSLIGGVSGFAVTLALSGIQLGCTRMVAEGLGQRDSALVRKTMRCVITHALFFGGVSGLLLLFGAPLIARYWLRDLRTLSSLRLMALTLPVIALSACFSGYFVAVRRVYKSASAQVLEEVLRIGCTLLLLQRSASAGLETALLSLAFSGVIADIFAGALLLVLYLWDRKIHFPRKNETPTPYTHTTVARRLLSVTMPVAVAAYARSGLITLEHMLIPIGLQAFGHTHSDALAAYGLVHSMALPVVLFPNALLSAFAGLLIPEVTEAHVRSEHRRIRGMMERVFGLTLFYSVGIAGLMIAFSQELGMVLYDSSQAARYIHILAPLIPIMYLDSATDAMLKGLGEQVYSMKVNIFDASLSVFLVWILVPQFGIMGYIITIYIAEILNGALSMVRLFRICSPKLDLFTWVCKPLFSIIVATQLTRLVYLFCRSGGVLTHITQGSGMIFFLSTAAFVYGLMLYISGALKRKDMTWISGFFRAG